MSDKATQDLRNRGWGIALLIIIVAIVANATAFSIHKATYLQPKGDAPAASAAH